MKYPMINNWLTFRRVEDNTYLLTDLLLEEEYTMGSCLAGFAKKLNGKTNPYKIDRAFSRSQVKSMLDKLSEFGLLRTKRLLGSSTGTLLYTLWIPKQSGLSKLTASIAYTLLRVLWLPILIAGIFLFANNIAAIDFNNYAIGCIAGILLGLLMHEYGHVCAGIHFNAFVFECGIGFKSFFPCAYTLMNCNHCKRIDRIRINAAGIEMNFLLTGAFLLAAVIFPSFGGFLYAAAASNALLGLLNLLLIEGLDGLSVFSDLLGGSAEDIISNAKKIAKTPKIRHQLLKNGFWGLAVITMSYALLVVQCGMVLLVAAEIVEVISCLF